MRSTRSRNTEFPPVTMANSQSENVRPFELDDLVHLEEMFQEEGRQEGVAAGERAGRPEGFALGLEKGYDMLMEVGYYEAAAKAWMQVVKAAKPLSANSGRVSNDLEEQHASGRDSARARFPARAAKPLESLLVLTTQFPKSNAHDAAMGELLDRIRAKWKLVCAVVGVPIASAAYGNGNVFTPITPRSSAASAPSSPTQAAGPANALGVPISTSQSLSF